MQQKTSARTIKRAAAVAMAAGALTVALPLTVHALPALDDDPAPVLADTGASGKEPAILMAGVVMLAGGAVVIGAARLRTLRAGTDDDYEDDDYDDDLDEDFDDDLDPAPADAETTPADEPPAKPTEQPGNAEAAADKSNEDDTKPEDAEPTTNTGDNDTRKADPEPPTATAAKPDNEAATPEPPKDKPTTPNTPS
ncbi:hypothetical protein [Yinghuangia seranimata]|uniref:hypothetical protein n=1 Tax=Yinghuangia seranimata TaxID=408067 RepID=UPI00248CD798|nr:hypothetical protein [Yinghuangia seranimata]MDI2125313.1 hypothetical protein [Yinghuangia seranimata]